MEYFFECSDPGFNSGWQIETAYTANGLSDMEMYGFRVKARDPSGNETEFSQWAYASTNEDSDAPSPNPSRWATLDHDGIDGLPTSTGIDSIRMIAYGSTDASGVVEYYFTCIDGFINGGDDSGWQSDPYYEDDGLELGITYTYTVRARDTWGNEPVESEPGSAIPEIIDDIAPTPDPAQWLILPVKIKVDGVWYHYMSSVEAADDSGVEYYFECLDVSSFSSGWQSLPGVDPEGDPIGPNEYWVAVGTEYANYIYRVKARDMSPLQNETVWSEMEMVQ
jgi:hypothetical protein